MYQILIDFMSYVYTVFALTHLPEARDSSKTGFGQVKIIKEFV